MHCLEAEKCNGGWNKISVLEEDMRESEGCVAALRNFEGGRKPPQCEGLRRQGVEGFVLLASFVHSASCRKQKRSHGLVEIASNFVVSFLREGLVEKR